MDNISFQGHTCLILNPKAYDKARVTTSNAYRHLYTNNKSKLTNGKIFTSVVDAQNLAVIVRNDQDGIMKHVPINGRIEQVIEEIAQKIGQNIPKTLNLSQQAEFALGYYQQRAEMFKKKE